MDIFGHTAASLLAGRTAAATPAQRRGTTVAALLAGLLPDVDAALYLWGADAFRQWHQVWTHNLVALALLPLVVGLAVGRWSAAGLERALAAAYLAAGLHLLGDLIGLWPVPLWMPFSDARLAWSLLPRDFCWQLDAILVLGAVITLWDPVAARVAWLRGVVGGTLVLAGIWVGLA